MVRPLRIHSGENTFVGELLEGCVQCSEGKKLVLFVTGKCNQGCFYCPLSEGRQLEVSFANEVPVTSDADIIREAKQMRATGTGITGGDPLIETEKTVEWIKMLKHYFGADFHTHLYTSDKEITADRLSQLYAAGLDEIRVHPKLYQSWSSAKDAVHMLTKYDWVVGAEIPALPGLEEEMKRFGEFLEENGVSFLNLNELEFTEENRKKLEAKNFNAAPGVNWARSSKEAALTVVDHFRQNGHSLSVHFCPSRYKDAVQLKNRFLRRGSNIKREFDELTDDGLLWYGRIETVDSLTAIEVASYLIQCCDIDEQMFELIGKDIEIAWYVAEELADALRDEFREAITYMCVLQRHPTEQGLVTLEEPL